MRVVVLCVVHVGVVVPPPARNQGALGDRHFVARLLVVRGLLVERIDQPASYTVL